MAHNGRKGFRLSIATVISGSLLTLGLAAQAQTTLVAPEIVPIGSAEPQMADPGWLAAVAAPVSPEQARQILGEPISAPPIAARGAAFATPSDYDALAEALEDDPLRIYQYVRNNFEYVPYYGLLKGPYLTLHERAGNDFDQASLLIELLRAAGHTANFRYGEVSISVGDTVGIQALADWLGTDADAQIIANTFANGGVPVSLGSSITFDRVYVEATLSSVGLVSLDPAFKPSTNYSPIDLDTATGYSEANLLAATGGTATATSIENMSASGLDVHLTGLATTLQNYLKTNHPNDRVEEVLGGSRIIPDQSTDLPTSLPLAISPTQSAWSSVPSNYIHTVRFQNGGIDVTKNIPDIAGRKVSLVFDGDPIDIPPPPGGVFQDLGSVEEGQASTFIGGLNWTNNNPIAVNVNASFTGTDAGAVVFDAGGGSTTVQPGNTLTIQYHLTGVGQTPGRKNPNLRLDFTASGANPSTNNLLLTGAIEPVVLAKLYIDDVEEATETSSSGATTLELDIDHPYAASNGNFADQMGVEFNVKRSGSYVIASAFGGDKHSTLLSERQRRLNRMSIDGTPPDADELLTETLNVMGQTWMQQTQLNSDMLNALSGERYIVHHRFGIVGQEDNYYVDMAAQILSPQKRVATPESGAFPAYGFIASAMEHSVLDQTQNTVESALSTIQVIALNNQNGDKLFVANNSNYASIKPQLTGYSTQRLDVEFPALVGQGRTLVLPENGLVNLNQWDGYGYVAYDGSGGGSILMAIQNGLNGGYNSTPGTAAPEPVIEATNPQRVEPAEVSPTRSQDPVDLMTGAFVSDITDFSVRGSGVRGLSFTRSYNSQMVNQDTAKLGRGWTHNYNIYLSHHSNVSAALGERTLFDTVSMVIANHVVRSLLEGASPSPSQWGSAALVSDWAMEQLLNKTITVHVGAQALTYQEMPDGTFSRPAGITTDLVRLGDDTYELHERFGTVWKFNADDKIASITDVDGNVMSFGYSSDGLSQVTDAYTRVLTLGYTNGELTSASDSTGHSTGYVQTGGNLTDVNGQENENWDYTYDPVFHRLETVTNAVGVKIVENIYDDFDRVVEQKMPRDTGLETYKLHYAGFVSSEEDPEGYRETYHFDLDGRRVAFENATGNIARMVYDGQGHMVGQTDPRGNTTTFIYDGDNNLEKQINDYGKEVTFSYDAQHRLEEIIDQLSHKDHFDYDTEHHLTYRRDHYLNEIKTEYLPNGLVDYVRDPRLYQTDYSYDANGYLNTAKTESHPVIDWDYNAKGLLDSLTDQEGATTSFKYDDRDRVEERTDALTKKTIYEYTDAGQLWKLTDRNGDLTEFTYTDSGKIDIITYPDSTINFNYDSRDNLWQMIDATGTSTNSYDAAGRLDGHTDSNGHSVSYDRDTAGNVSTLTYPGGNTVTYVYDNLNRLDTVTIDWLSRTMKFHYDDANRLDYVEHFNDMQTDYTWDDADRLTGIEHKGLVTLVDYSFVLDASGNRDMETISPEPIKPESLINNATTLNYNTQRNRLESTTDHSFGYDDEGQQTSKDAIAYDFDYAHRLIQRDADVFVYDGVGNRLSATRSGVETQYIYDAVGNLLAEANDNGQIQRYYIYAGGLAAMVTASGDYYVYHFDGTGHTVAMTDNANGVVNKYAYSPYGDVLGEEEQIEQPFKYAGQVGIFTEDDSLYYMRARYYDAETGRFISEDPAGFIDGPNLYAYVGGNPILLVDPSGLGAQNGYDGPITALMGAGASAVALYGFEGSFGGLVTPGGFRDFDIGAFLSYGEGIGWNISADAFGGAIQGDAFDLQGDSLNINLVAGPGSLTVMMPSGDGPLSIRPTGGTGGAGPSATALGASVTASSTAVISRQTMIRALTDMLCSATGDC